MVIDYDSNEIGIVGKSECVERLLSKQGVGATAFGPVEKKASTY